MDSLHRILVALAELGVDPLPALVTRLFKPAEQRLWELPPNLLPRLLWSYKQLRPQAPASLVLKLRQKVSFWQAAALHSAIVHLAPPSSKNQDEDRLGLSSQHLHARLCLCAASLMQAGH